MAVPKRRLSSSKRNMRRAQNDKIAVPQVVPCPECGEPMVPHRVCPACGQYKGRKIVGEQPVATEEGSEK